MTSKQPDIAHAGQQRSEYKLRYYHPPSGSGNGSEIGHTIIVSTCDRIGMIHKGPIFLKIFT